MNAFDWVCCSTRPVLISTNRERIWGRLSDVWRTRVSDSSPELRKAINSDEFRGMAIVPLPDMSEPRSPIGDNREPSRAWGVVVALSMARAGAETSHEIHLNPAHAFLYSRLAKVIAGYLMPLHPLPRCRYWLGDS